MTVTYPSGDLTPMGWHQLSTGKRPTMWLDAYDGSIRFNLLGGLAPPYHDPTVPEAVSLRELKGLIPPWRHITQKGATQDGVTHIDALYDPIEVQATLDCVGRDQKYLRQVVRHLYGAVDAKQQSTLNFVTPQMGHWWAPVRWFQGGPTDPVGGLATPQQTVSLRLLADDGFWRTQPHTDLFTFAYESMLDTFDTDYSGSSNLGPNWPQYYSGAGAGYCSTTSPGTFFNYEQARWFESGTTAYEVVNGPYDDGVFSETDTDNQVVNMVLGSMPEATFLEGSYNDIWARMGRDGGGAWNGDGIRCRIGINPLGLGGWVKLSRFNNFVETAMRERVMLIPPLPSEKFTLIAGFEDNTRRFSIQRNGLSILNHVESGTGSLLGSAYRGVGFGMYAGAGILSQASPAWVRKISAGDNATVAQEGYLTRVNVGDQPMYDDYTLFGPGTFKIYDGPASTDYVQFGPLLPNQIAYIRTDPRKRAVQDLTVVPPSPQELNIFQEALQQFLSFASGGNTIPLLQEIESMFGIRPPQANFYSLLDGRFSEACAIPAQSPGADPQAYQVKVAIDDGDASSKIIASGTPLRRFPL